MTENKILYACKDHIDVALDDYINCEENAPHMVEVSDENQIVCSYCEQKAKYSIMP